MLLQGGAHTCGGLGGPGAPGSLHGCLIQAWAGPATPVARWARPAALSPWPWGLWSPLVTTDGSSAGGGRERAADSRSPAKATLAEPSSETSACHVPLSSGRAPPAPGLRPWGLSQSGQALSVPWPLFPSLLSFPVSFQHVRRASDQVARRPSGSLRAGHSGKPAGCAAVLPPPWWDTWLGQQGLGALRPPVRSGSGPGHGGPQ